MTFLVISHAPHFWSAGRLYSYGPLVKELILWEKCAGKLLLFAPEVPADMDPINLPYQAESTNLISCSSLDFTTNTNRLQSLVRLPGILFKMWFAMCKADHVHLRCPGNLALIGCVLQIFLPWKKKTVKYAGNWDPASPQPLTYKIQQWICNNSWISRNMTVLVYGNWPHSSKNILPFFTASYFQREFLPFKKPDLNLGINLVFVGSLVPAKNPMTAIKVLDKLRQKNLPVSLVFCGEGTERENIERYREAENLKDQVRLAGNVSAAGVKEIFIQSHFLIFLSDSEGWPKVVAEAMSWSCIPMTSGVSCVPEMVGHGERGKLVQNEPDQIAKAIIKLVNDPVEMQRMQTQAHLWAKQFTLERFGEALCKLV